MPGKGSRVKVCPPRVRRFFRLKAAATDEEFRLSTPPGASGSVAGLLTTTTGVPHFAAAGASPVALRRNHLADGGHFERAAFGTLAGNDDRAWRDGFMHVGSLRGSVGLRSGQMA
jgi:hypothetical protein